MKKSYMYMPIVILCSVGFVINVLILRSTGSGLGFWLGSVIISALVWPLYKSLQGRRAR